jgi:hypothetical protein
MKPRYRIFAETRLFGFLHHLLLATTISSLLLALHATPLYPVIDNLTYSIVASRRQAKMSDVQKGKTSPRPPSWHEDEYPLVVILSPGLAYGGDRKEMQTALVRQVDEAVGMPRPGESPRVLAIVSDLGPEPFDVLADGLKAQSRLDQALDAIRRKMFVVSLVPLLRDDQVGHARFQWLVARCRAGHQFALPEPRGIGQPVYGYWSNIESPGVLAWKLAGRAPAVRATTAGEHPSAAFNVCETAMRRAGDFPAFVEEARVRAPGRSLAHERPLNHEYFEFSGNLQFVGATVPTPAGDAPALPLSQLGRAGAVFIGVDELERATVGGDPILPVDVYAAEFFTEGHPVRPLTLWLAFGLDVVLGLLLGYSFAFGWEQYARAAIRLETMPLFPLGRKALMYLGVRVGLLGLNLALLGLALWGCLRMAGMALDYRLWLNPLPIVLGTSIDGLLHSRRRADADEPRDLKAFLTKHFDAVAQVLIIVAALGWVVVYSIRTGH